MRTKNNNDTTDNTETTAEITETNTTIEPTVGSRLLRKPEMLRRVGFAYSTIWQWMTEGKFPRSRERGGRSCWVETEVEAWIKDSPVKHLKGDQQQALKATNLKNVPQPAGAPPTKRRDRKRKKPRRS